MLEKRAPYIQVLILLAAIGLLLLILVLNKPLKKPLIAYLSVDGTSYDIFTMNVDGSNPQNITHSNDEERYVNWSPDGRWLLYETTWFVPDDAHGHFEDAIWVMDADGNNRRKLTPDSVWGGQPAWSPDGKQIAFSSYVGENSEIYVMDANGSNIQRLTDHGDADMEPTWSPDSQHIAFLSNRDGTSDIYIMNRDGSALRKLTDNREPTFIYGYPRWSPDGNRILFTAEYYDKDGIFDSEVYTTSVSDGSIEQITHNYDFDYNPNWSPDGTKIVYGLMVEPANFEIFVMDADGKNPHRLTHSDRHNMLPTWRP